MGVDHGGPNISGPKELLHCSDVVTAFVEVSSRGVAKDVATSELVCFRLQNNNSHGTLNT